MPSPTPIKFRKHREARYRYSGGFSKYLADGETISAPELRVERYAGYRWEDASAEILEEESVAVDGSAVEFTLRAAANDAEQPPGTYRLIAGVTASTGERPVGVVEFEVES